LINSQVIENDFIRSSFTRKKSNHQFGDIEKLQKALKTIILTNNCDSIGTIEIIAIVIVIIITKRHFQFIWHKSNKEFHDR